jgi:hypothetical protein
MNRVEERQVRVTRHRVARVEGVVAAPAEQLCARDHGLLPLLFRSLAGRAGGLVDGQVVVRAGLAHELAVLGCVHFGRAVSRRVHEFAVLLGGDGGHLALFSRQASQYSAAVLRTNDALHALHSATLSNFVFALYARSRSR